MPGEFGMCRSPMNPAVRAAGGAPVPCTPECELWTNGKRDTVIEGMPALISISRTVCFCGGIIEITDDGQRPRVGSVKNRDSMLEIALKQLLKGEYADDVNLLGTGLEIGAGFIPLVGQAQSGRDLTHNIQNWEWTWGHAGVTAAVHHLVIHC